MDKFAKLDARTKKHGIAISANKSSLKEIVRSVEHLDELAKMQACEGLAIAMDFSDLKKRVIENEKKHPPFTYSQFRNILLLVWIIVISVLSMVFYEQS